MASRMGMRPGWSLDLTTIDDSGAAWDFTKPSMKLKAIQKPDKEQPELLVVSPVCVPFSKLQGLNFSKMHVEQVEDRLEEGMKHLKFAMEMCRRQAALGRLFTFGHPLGAKSWDRWIVNQVMRLPNAVTVDFDFRCVGMMSRDALGTGHVKERTGALTNSSRIAERLSRAQWKGGHRHVHLVNFRAGPCQGYPEESRREICIALKEEIVRRSAMMSDSTMIKLLAAVRQEEAAKDHPHDGLEESYPLYHGRGFYDDIHGKPLGKDMAIKAMKLEIDFFRRMGVYTKVVKSEPTRPGAKIIDTKWIDIGKGDSNSPDYRARLAGREIKTDQRPELFVATPPLESLRMIIFIC